MARGARSPSPSWRINLIYRLDNPLIHANEREFDKILFNNKLLSVYSRGFAEDLLFLAFSLNIQEILP